MSKCEKTKEILVDWTFGAGMLDGLDRKHLETCSDCRQLFEEAESLKPVLQDYSGRISQEANRLLSKARQKQSSALLSARSFRFQIPNWMKIAAGFVVAAGGIYLYNSLHFDRPEPAYIVKMDTLSSRGAIQSYIGKTQLFLMSLFPGEEECGDPGESVLVDRALAEKLVYQKRLLDPKLNSDEYQDLKPLLDQLELLLMDIAGSDGCVRKDDLELWRSMIDSRSTLLKLNLLQMEGRI
jgi:hypothetical protein